MYLDLARAQLGPDIRAAALPEQRFKQICTQVPTSGTGSLIGFHTFSNYTKPFGIVIT